VSINDARIDGYRLQEAPIHLLRLSLQRMTDLFQREAPDGLTLRQFVLLLAAHQHPGATQTDLVGLTGIDRSTVGDMLDRLVKRGLIRRKRSGDDQRANAIHVLPPGEAALAAAMPAAASAQDAFLAPVPAELRAAFMKQLRRVAGVNEGANGAAIPVGEPRAVAGPAA
jgi:DNA-binding MarR family transcriptional regulator